jgi:hypothetical protein
MAQRACTNCGKWYYRRNKIEMWVTRNPGHRTGWEKIDERLCLECSDNKQTRRIVAVLAVRPVARGRKRA